MILEIKILLSVISMICMAIVMCYMIWVSLTLAFICIIAIGLTIFGDMIMGHYIKKTKADLWYEKPPQNKELGIIFSLTGLVDLIWATKKPHGKREFVFNKEEASVIDTGNYPIHLLSGAHGFIGHESYDENINMFEVKAAEKIKKDLGSDDIKEVYFTAIKKEDEL